MATVLPDSRSFPSTDLLDHPPDIPPDPPDPPDPSLSDSPVTKLASQTEKCLSSVSVSADLTLLNSDPSPGNLPELSK